MCSLRTSSWIFNLAREFIWTLQTSSWILWTSFQFLNFEQETKWRLRTSNVRISHFEQETRNYLYAPDVVLASSDVIPDHSDDSYGRFFVRTELVLMDAKVGIKAILQKARDIAKEIPHGWYCDQFDNHANQRVSRTFSENRTRMQPRQKTE